LKTKGKRKSKRIDLDDWLKTKWLRDNQSEAGRLKKRKELGVGIGESEVKRVRNRGSESKE